MTGDEAVRNEKIPPYAIEITSLEVYKYINPDVGIYIQYA